MGQTVIDEILKKHNTIPLALKPAVNGSVVMARKNYHELDGRYPGKNLFYREADADEYRRTTAQRFFLLYMSLAFAKQTSGAVVEQEMQSWFDLRASLQTPTLFSPQNFWDEYEQAGVLMSRAGKSYGNFDANETRLHLVKLQEKVGQMLRLVNAMPQFGKK